MFSVLTTQRKPGSGGEGKILPSCLGGALERKATRRERPAAGSRLSCHRARNAAQNTRGTSGTRRQDEREPAIIRTSKGSGCDCDHRERPRAGAAPTPGAAFAAGWLARPRPAKSPRQDPIRQMVFLSGRPRRRSTFLFRWVLARWVGLV